MRTSSVAFVCCFIVSSVIVAVACSSNGSSGGGTDGGGAASSSGSSSGTLPAAGPGNCALVVSSATANLSFQATTVTSSPTFGCAVNLGTDSCNANGTGPFEDGGTLLFTVAMTEASASSYTSGTTLTWAAEGAGTFNLVFGLLGVSPGGLFDGTGGTLTLDTVDTSAKTMSLHFSDVPMGPSPDNPGGAKGTFALTGECNALPFSGAGAPGGPVSSSSSSGGSSSGSSGGDGGSATMIVQGETGPAGVAVDDTYVYWANADSSEIRRVAKSGGTPETLAQGLSYPNGIAVQGGALYFDNWGSGTVMQLALTGADAGAAVQIATGQSTGRGVVTDGTNLYVAVGSTAAFGTATSVSEIVIATGVTSTLFSTPAAGGLAINSQGIYLANSQTGDILRVGLNGQNPTTLGNVGTADPVAVAVDANNVYWVDNGGGTTGQGAIMKMPLAGGTPAAVITGLTDPWYLAVDANNVYWSSHGPGMILSYPL